MKYLILLFASIFIIGCSDTIVSPVKSITPPKPNTPQHIVFEIVKYYTCNDSICPPDESLILIDTVLNSNINTVNISTGDSTIIFNGTLFHLQNFTLWNTIASDSYVTINGSTYILNGFIYTEINLDCNESYPIKYGTNY